MRKIIVASAAALLLGAPLAHADTTVSVLGGPTFAPGLNVNGTRNAMDTGFNVGARVGTSLDRWSLPDLSVEADGLFSRSTYSNAKNARLQSSSYMANLIYHMPTNSPVRLMAAPLMLRTMSPGWKP